MGHISNPIVNRLGFSSFWSSFWSSFLEKNYSYFLSEDFALEDFIFWFFFSKKNSVLKKEHYLISKFSIYRTFSRFIIKINYIPLLEDNSIIFMFFSLLRVRFSFLSTFRKVSLTSDIGSSVIKSKSNDNIFVFLLNMWLPKKNFSNWCFIYCGITQDSKLLANRYKNWKNNSFLQKKIKLDLSLLKLKKKFRIFYKKLSSIKVFFFEKLSFRCKFFFLKTLYLLDKLDLKLDLRSLKNAVELLNLILRLVFFYKSLKFQINLFLDRRKFFINRFRNNIRVPLIEYWLSDIDHRRHFLRLHKSLNVISADELKLSKKFKFLLSDDLDSRNNFTSLEGNSFCYSSFLKLKLLRLHFLVFFIRFFNLKKKIDKKTFYLFSVYFFLNLKLSESNAPFGLKKKKKSKHPFFFSSYNFSFFTFNVYFFLWSLNKVLFFGLHLKKLFGIIKLNQNNFFLVLQKENYFDLSAHSFALMLKFKLVQGFNIFDFVGRFLRSFSLNPFILNFKVLISGRYSRASRTKIRVYKKGSMPLNTFRMPVDYGFAHGFTKFGACGIKIFINKIFLKKGDKKRLLPFFDFEAFNILI